MVKELLAPAGDIEAGYAALYYGADAVYLGLQKFSARATATNFDERNLNEFTAYAHSLQPRRKVFVAINTLVRESELPALLESLEICRRCQVDAVIVQDLGVAKIVRDLYPELELHASTQMAVHNKEGALVLQRFGFKRVVLARELTRAEIAEIAAVPGLETEAFIHGTLCYSYSGLCLFSAMETGRSANRGKCLYPCRSLFEGESGLKHYFSMKDLALEEDVLNMPAYSLKIEGRKKSALYVAAVTDYYRRILDSGKADKRQAQNIRQIFSRPWTKFHFNGKNKDVVDRDFVGHRGLAVGTVLQAGNGRICFVPAYRIARHDGLQIDVTGQEKPFGFSLLKLRVNGKNVFEAAPGEKVEVKLPPQAPDIQKGDKVYLASSSEVKGAYPYSRPKPGEYRLRPAVDVRVRIEPDRVVAEACGVRAELDGVWDKAKEPEKMVAAVQRVFDKTGDEAFVLGSLDVQNGGGWFVPVSVLNALRRDLYARVKPAAVQPRLLKQPEPRKADVCGRQIVKIFDPAVLDDFDCHDVDEILVAVDEHFEPDNLKGLPKNKVRLALPAVCRNVCAMMPVIESCLAAGYKKWEADNYWAVQVLPRKGIDLSFGGSIYMFNSQAVAAARELGASRVTLAVEDTVDNMRELAEVSSLPVVLPVYEQVPLFISAVCLRDHSCKDCTRERKVMTLKRNGRVYKVLSANCQTMVFDEQPFSLSPETAASIKAEFKLAQTGAV